MGGVLLGVAKAGLVQAGTEMSRRACPMSLSVCTVPMTFPSPAQGLQMPFMTSDPLGRRAALYPAPSTPRDT